MKIGYCLAAAGSSGFTDNSFVVGPRGGVAVNVMPNLQLRAGTDLMWFTGDDCGGHPGVPAARGWRTRAASAMRERHAQQRRRRS